MSQSSQDPYQPDVARAAIDAMEERNLPPTPEFFQLWVTYLAKADEGLLADMEQTLSSETEFSMADAERLYNEHFGVSTMQATLDDVGERMSAQLASALDNLRAAGRTTRAFGQTLEGASNILPDPSTNMDAHRAVLATLVTASKKMHEQNAALARRLEETRSEVQELKVNLDQARVESLTDGLTDIANRKHFDEVFAQAFTASETENTPLALILTDVDRFKSFNDTWGHQTGDQVLRFVAKSLERIANDSHLVARYGGEEFVIVLPHTELDEAVELAEQMRAQVKSRRLVRRTTDEDLGIITSSFGIAGRRADDTPESLIKRADEMLYLSKERGRDCVTSDADQEQDQASTAA